MYRRSQDRREEEWERLIAMAAIDSLGIEAATLPEEMNDPKPTSLAEIMPLIEEGKFLGEGSYGSCHKIIFEGQLAVAKVGRANNDAIRQSFIHEASVLEVLDGAGGAPRVLAFSFYNENEPPVFIQSLCEGATFLDLLNDNTITKGKVLPIIGEIALALDQIHQKGIVHNDIKTDNIIIDFTEEGYPIVHIIDFGLSKPMGDHTALNADPHNSVYAPEICGIGGQCSSMSDIYSVGVLIFDALDARGWSMVPWAFRLMMRAATRRDPELRPTLHQIHHWLSTAYNEKHRYGNH